MLGAKSAIYPGRYEYNPWWWKQCSAWWRVTREGELLRIWPRTDLEGLIVDSYTYPRCYATPSFAVATVSFLRMFLESFVPRDKRYGAMCTETEQTADALYAERVVSGSILNKLRMQICEDKFHSEPVTTAVIFSPWYKFELNGVFIQKCAPFWKSLVRVPFIRATNRLFRSIQPTYADFE